MIERGRFFLPGPTEVRKEILETMLRPMISHRGAEYEEILQRIHARLKPLFGTARPVYVVSASGTGSMEMAIRNGTRRHVLSIVGGGFGSRFASLAKECGRDVTRLNVPLDEAVRADDVRAALDAGEYDAVTMVHSESSTGVLADVAAVGAVVRERDDVLLLVDGVTSVGAMPIAMDAWGVDFYFTGSQKALALPPGLSFAAVSQRLLERASSIPNRGYYLDVPKHEEFTAKHQSPVTPPVSLIYALDMQLADVEREGLDARFERHASMARACHRWASSGDRADLGVCVFPKSPMRSPTVSCFTITRRTPSIVHRMREQGYVIGGGYGELSGTTFRIGHMGDHTLGGVEAMLEVLDGVLRMAK
jgi:aspartate aminotransferase-like enzyme